MNLFLLGVGDLNITFNVENKNSQKESLMQKGNIVSVNPPIDIFLARRYSPCHITQKKLTTAGSFYFHQLMFTSLSNNTANLLCTLWMIASLKL